MIIEIHVHFLQDDVCWACTELEACSSALVSKYDATSGILYVLENMLQKYTNEFAGSHGLTSHT
jgi:hypothetical protein